ncbi:hypothetical protein AVEN_154979-1 [Araneus ventricosus]|uniref:Uncharacterized protein n=1 Tax=Araneus ventricosus TaxID=182803 RepID=A0A4Y2A7Y1_ARAVE|nr:hypothetical protein AVEN_154979-1 [Araneus ventricosus]
MDLQIDTSRIKNVTVHKMYTWAKGGIHSVRSQKGPSARRLSSVTSQRPHISPMLIAFTPLGLGLGVVWSDGNEEGTPIYTWMNSAHAELHLFSILHGIIRFHLQPHGRVRDENAKVREAATVKYSL